jgi:hypothetical protein
MMPVAPWRRGRWRVRRWIVAAVLVLHGGCIALRVGAGASHRGDSGEPPGTWNTELGLMVPLGDDGAVSALAVVRARTANGAKPLLGLEAMRFLDRPTWPGGADGDAPDPTRRAVMLGGRLELGRDDLGRYLGGAAVARTILPWDALSPFLPSLSLVLHAGWYDGPVHGPALGVGLLAGFW